MLHCKENTGPLTEIPVAAGVLQATAQLLAEFFDMHPAARVALGHFLAARDEHAIDTAIEGAGPRPRQRRFAHRPDGSVTPAVL